MNSDDVKKRHTEVVSDHFGISHEIFTSQGDMLDRNDKQEGQEGNVQRVVDADAPGRSAFKKGLLYLGYESYHLLEQSSVPRHAEDADKERYLDADLFDAVDQVNHRSDQVEPGRIPDEDNGLYCQDCEHGDGVE